MAEKISKRLKLELSKLERVNFFVLLNSIRPRMLQEAEPSSLFLTPFSQLFIENF